MHKASKIIIVLLLFLIACTPEEKIIKTVKIGDGIFYVEVADTPEKRVKGLMLRESLDNGKGMLFEFQDEFPRSFWMKDTLIPLDIIFISKDKVIVNITTAGPCQTMPCKSYSSGKPAMYVLEINAGEASKKNIKIGDSIEIIE